MIDVVSTQFGITAIRSGARPSRSGGRASARRSRPSCPRVWCRTRRGLEQRTSSGLVSRPSAVAISGKTSWLTTTSGARCRRATPRQVADDRRIGHAEHESGPLERQRRTNCPAKIREVVIAAGGASTDRRTSTECAGRGRRRPARRSAVLSAPDPARHDGDLVRVGEIPQRSASRFAVASTPGR